MTQPSVIPSLSRNLRRPVFSDPTHASALLRELDSWLGTPWAHMANRPGKQLARKGVGGDCVTIILTALYNVGAVEPLDLPAHVAAPGISAENEVAHSITKFVRPFLDAGRLELINPKRDPLMMGDLLTFKMGGARDHHLGITHASTWFYHCPGPGYVFMRSSLNEFGSRFQSAYRLIQQQETSE